MKIRTKVWWQTVLSTAVGALMFAGAAGAQQLDDGAKARVNLSSKLGMLSYQIAGATCRLHAGIDAPQARALLHDSQVEIRTILEGLEFGNRQLGIPTPEKHSRLLRSLRVVGEEWGRMSAAIDSVVSGTDVAGNTVRIVDGSRALDEKASKLAAEINARYSNPNEMLFVDGLAIHMAGRQRILIQKAAAEACLRASGAGDVTSLTETTELFQKTLTALRDGMAAAGIRKPPNEKVQSTVDDAWKNWEASREAYGVLELSSAVEPTLVHRIAAEAEQLTKQMNDLVILYMLSSPGRDGAIRSLLAEVANTELIRWVQDPALVAAVKVQNQLHASLAQPDIDRLDKQWRAEAKGGGGPLVDDLMARPLSIVLREKQVATAGFINEIFVMDNLGLNVAQSAVTSDYWQGDEDKWQLSYGDGTGEGAVHISEVEFDDSTGVYQSQVSIPVKDLQTGKLLGAMTFGVNVQSLM